MARLFDRKGAGGIVGGRATAAALDSVGVVEGVSGANAALLLAAVPGLTELGHPGVYETEATAGNAAVTITVPTGKYWRLVALHHLLVTDATVANRAVVVKTRTAADAAIETITHANVAASTTAKRNTLFGSDDYLVGSTGVAAQGTLSMATKPTANDTVVLNGQTFTWKAALTAAGQLLIGANVAASQAAMEAAFKDRDNGGVLHTVTDAQFAAIEMTMGAFAANDAIFTANVKGTAGNALATTETFTAGGNVFDAATLGTTTTGVDQADKVSALDYPDAGVLLTPGEDVNITVTNGVAGDALDTYLVYLEFDANPVP